ncbi:MAG: GIY-YIG nuclease family protein [Syntrophomonadaceae bacterium]|nr:GIY-YIG nuclease family protein [Syntrophomonadaceae bacterium]
MPYVYILKCRDGSYYTGYTTDLYRRVEEHNQGTASKYTRGRLPVECVYFEFTHTVSEALKRENSIKKLSRSQKDRLVQSFNGKPS